MADIVVRIDVAPGTGKLSASEEKVADFTYHPSTFTCTRDDVIQWQCPQGPFALHFGERPLLGKTVIRSTGKNSQGCYEAAELRVGERVHAGAVTKIPPGVIQQGMHKYSVAVAVVPGQGLSAGVYIDACPGGGYEC